MKIIALSGSLRKGSYTTKLVEAFQRYAPDDAVVEIVTISQLPFINQDLEMNLPDVVRRLHETIRHADGVLLATPEYNRSYSPVLKNALDWGSRPPGDNAWDGKPVGIVGVSPHTLGAFGAVHHLRQVLVYLNMPVMQQPEFYLALAGEKFDENGYLTDDNTIDKIQVFWKAFHEWVDRTGKNS